jgi:hypothetical protein
MRVAIGSATRQRLAGAFRYGLAGLLLLAIPLLAAPAADAQTKCGSQDKNRPATLQRPGFSIPAGSPQPTLEVNGYCDAAPGGDYLYGTVNVTIGGVLTFKEGQSSDQDKVTNFWAQSIIVENGGAIKAGVDTEKPYGTAGCVVYRVVIA